MHEIFNHLLQRQHLLSNYKNRNLTLDLEGIEILSDLTVRQMKKPDNVLVYGYCDERIAAQYSNSNIVYANFIKELNPLYCNQTIEYREENLALPDQSFDLALSNMSLQFANDFPRAIQHYKKILKEDGLFIGVFIGEDSLQELRLSFAYADQEVYDGVFARVMPMISLASALDITRRTGFKNVVCHIEEKKVLFSGIVDLMNSLSNMGFSDFLYEASGKPTSKEWLQKAELYYSQHYLVNKLLDLTFKIVTISGFA